MGAIRDHRRRIREHLEGLDAAIAVGAERRPVTVGLHASACAAELLELYLHKEGKIPIGKVVKHDWFKRPLPEQKADPLIERKLEVDFPSKKDVYDLMYMIEENRTNLVYGRATKEQVDAVLAAFGRLRQLLGGDDDE